MNRLGNVLAVISDRKIPKSYTVNSTFADYDEMNGMFFSKMNEISKFFVFVYLLVQISCSPIIHIPGRFASASCDNNTEIEFKANGTFVLTQKSIEIEKSCKGEWCWYLPNRIIINCENELEVIRVLSNGYMETPKDSILIIGKRKIKMGNIILRKVE